MEYERLSRDARLPYIVHVQPTPALEDDSWAWSECRRTAYHRVCWALALAVATQVLRGGSFKGQESEFSTSSGCVRFTISQAGTTVRIRIFDFTGPNVPGPNGGLGRQPAAISDLLIGLHPSNGYFYVAVFLGVAPDTSDWIVVSRASPHNIGSSGFITRLNEKLFIAEPFEGAPELMSPGMAFRHLDANSIYQKMSMENETSVAEIQPVQDFLKGLPSGSSKDQRTELFGNESELIFDPQRISERTSGNTHLPMPGVHLQLRQRHAQEIQDVDLD
jgi:hypothetical protein